MPTESHMKKLRIHRHVAALCSLLIAGAACGPTATDRDGLGTTDGGGDGNPPQADASIFADASCGAQTAEIPLIELGDPPDLLIVLDRSGSMTLPPGFPISFGASKWDIMENAIENITNTYNNNIRFGVASFPSDDDICGVTPGADVSIDIGNAPAVNAWMGSHSPDGNTPAHLALQNASSIYSGLAANPGGQYVLFATDGAPNCGGTPVDPDTGSADQTVAAVTALNAQGVGTYVLGFGSVLGLDTGVLNDAAIAGGHPKPGGPPHYYHADDAQSLDAALMAIAGGIVEPSCSFDVTETPPDPDLVTVTIEGTPVPRDAAHNNGWDYHPDANTITFFGAACASVQEGETSVSFVFGCPGPIVD
ncbi:MAG: VWA domain-containing protein [Myxococcales bacterium]|nr:VWA domain-containing protein [Myxococcales bacterium]